MAWARCWARPITSGPTPRKTIRTDVQLQNREYVTGQYSIADIAIFPWIRSSHRSEKVPLTADDYPNVKAWLERLDARPAVIKGLAVETPKTEMDEEARKHLFGPGQDRK